MVSETRDIETLGAPLTPAAYRGPAAYRSFLTELVRDGITRFSDMEIADWRRLVVEFIRYRGWVESVAEALSDGEEARLLRHFDFGFHRGLRADHNQQAGEVIWCALERWATRQLACEIHEVAVDEAERQRSMEEAAADDKADQLREDRREGLR